MAQSLGIVHVLVSGEATEHGLPQHSDKCLPAVLTGSRIRERFPCHRAEAERVVEFPIGKKPGVRGHGRAAKMQIKRRSKSSLSTPSGNIFLTNIHRVYLGEVREPVLEDDDLREYFLSPFGDEPVGKTTDSNIDLGEIVREIDELAVFNDEAHHIHDPRLAWFKCIQDIHHQLLQKDRRLAIQVDVTATPRHNNGAIFVQTVSDYPFVEAIAQNAVKHPVLPDAASRAKLAIQTSSIITEKYADYLHLGVEEWRKSYAEHEKLGKKAVLFVMVDDTRNCDEVGEHLQKICPKLQDAVLVIHTKANDEISEASTGKSKEELEKLRKEPNEIDIWKSPYKAIVSILYA
jgi:type III restriction enzyme